MKLEFTLIGLLLSLVMLSAFAVIYTKHESRKTFVEIQSLRKQIDELNVEWGRLQLEQGTWSAHGRVEAMAHAQLKMQLPDINEIVYIQP
ncbi:MAG: cell division protein FtsL [Gammaproteobacteria bacterium]|jgi:cell division protein FtsL|nr:cell division protein FtsL [Gammaproteobacteria bacterium]